MTRTIRNTLYGLAGLLFLLLTVGCGNATVEPELFQGYVLDASNSIGLRIVRADGADDTVIREALRIRKYFAESIGADVELVSDWKRSEGNTESAEINEAPHLEIMVGVTDEAEVLQDDGDYYLLKKEGNELKILATCETLLHDAVDRFLNNYIFCEKDIIYLSDQVDYRSSAYPFFRIAKSRSAKCSFVLPNRAGEALVSATTYLANRLSEDGDCQISVIEADMSTLGKRNIWICPVDCLPKGNLPAAFSALPEAGNGVVYADESNIYVIGGDESGTIAALSEFFAGVTASADEKGEPYLYYNRSQTIEASWNRKIPYLVGAVKQSEDRFAVGSEMIVFDRVDSDMLDHFSKRLLTAGLQQTNASAEGRGKQAFAFESADMRLQLHYDAATGTVTMYLTTFSD